MLREGADVTTAQLRIFVGERLAPYKVPHRVVVVEALPRGRTGKIERTNLAATLGLDAPAASGREAGVHVDPTDDVERELCSIWQRVLDLDVPPSTDREFLELGDSLNATELLVDVEEAFGRRLPATIFLTGATVQTMAEVLRGSATSRLGASVFPVQVGGTRPPLFCLLRGGAVITVRHLAAAVGSDQPVYALWYPAMHGPPDAAGSLEEIAAECAAAIRAARPDGPYFLFGHSLGAIVVYEVARQLVATGGGDRARRARRRSASTDRRPRMEPLENRAAPSEEVGEPRGSGDGREADAPAARSGRYADTAHRVYPRH